MNITGYHLTRLHPSEIVRIEADGLALPSDTTTHQRIDALVGAGAIDAETATELHKNARPYDGLDGQIHAYFDRHYLSRDDVGGRFLLGAWGGEAVYWNIKRDPVLGRKLAAIGDPVIIEIVVRATDVHSFQAPPIQGFLRRPLPASAIRVIRSADPEFDRLVPWAVA